MLILQVNALQREMAAADTQHVGKKKKGFTGALRYTRTLVTESCRHQHVANLCWYLSNDKYGSRIPRAPCISCFVLATRMPILKIRYHP